MIGIVIVAHGGLAREYLAAVEHVMGELPGTAAVSIAPDDDRAAKQAEIDVAVASVDAGYGVVVVTDIYGGTPSNLAARACERPDRTMLYGANVPLLIQLAKARRLPLREAVDSALAAGRKYINCVNGVAQRTRPIAI